MLFHDFISDYMILLNHSEYRRTILFKKIIKENYTIKIFIF